MRNVVKFPNKLYLTNNPKYMLFLLAQILNLIFISLSFFQFGLEMKLLGLSFL